MGQTGHVYGTDGIRPHDGCGPEVGCVPPNFFVFIVLTSSQSCFLKLKLLACPRHAHFAEREGASFLRAISDSRSPPQSLRKDESIAGIFGYF